MVAAIEDLAETIDTNVLRWKMEGHSFCFEAALKVFVKPREAMVTIWARDLGVILRSLKSKVWGNFVVAELSSQETRSDIGDPKSRGWLNPEH